MAVTYSQNGVIVRGSGERECRLVSCTKAHSGVPTIDSNGYIGDISQDEYPYYNNLAILVVGADFSSKGLGQVEIQVPGTMTVDGRTYNTIKIGDMEWMTDNLDLTWNDLSVVTSSMSYSSDTPMGCYYKYDEATYGWNGEKRGLFYNNAAIVDLTCKKDTLIPGWHVPTWAELERLISYTKTTEVDDFHARLMNAKTGWTFANYAGVNGYKFNALPYGYFNGTNNITNTVRYSSISFDSNYGQRRLIFSYNKVSITGSNYDQSYLGYMRLIRDYPTYQITIGGESYDVIRVGNREWITRELNFRWDGLANFDKSMSSSDTTPRAKSYNGRVYYNRYAVKYLHDNKDTLLPEGWDVPATSDFNSLINSCNERTMDSYAGGSTDSNGAKILKSTTGWDEGYNGVNAYGFNGKPTGTFIQDSSDEGRFDNPGTGSYFFANGDNVAYYYGGFNSKNGMYNGYTSDSKYGYCVRLFRNVPL